MIEARRAPGLARGALAATSDGRAGVHSRRTARALAAVRANASHHGGGAGVGVQVQVGGWARRGAGSRVPGEGRCRPGQLSMSSRSSLVV